MCRSSTPPLRAVGQLQNLRGIFLHFSTSTSPTPLCVQPYQHPNYRQAETMECLHGRISYASWRLRQFRQLFNNSSLRGPVLHHHHHHHRSLTTLTDEPQQPSSNTSPSTPYDTPSTPTPTEHDTYAPPPSSLLPKSPLLTNPKPGYERLHRKKARSKPPPEDDLSTNPWAVALATPVRQCALTGLRFPAAFLTGWGLDEHPEGSLFIHPSEIMPAAPSPSPSPSSTATPLSSPQESQPQLQPQPQQQSTTQSTHHLIRMIDRLPLLTTLTQTIQKSKGRKIPAIVHIFPQRWKAPFGPLTDSFQARCVWRQDMPQFVTRMMRREVGRRLRKAATQPNDSSKRGVWTSVLRVEELGDDGVLAEEVLVDAITKMEPIARMATGAVLVLRRTSAPLPLSSFFHLPQTDSKVPVFDLTRLLTEEDLACEKFEDQAAVFFRPDDKPTVKAMLALWKLAGLLRDDPHYDPHHDAGSESS
ncbi:uncharacterized protein BP01DRAFT_389822 [Aspergillus saccharolyticus JOP 1030-1]|uniref:Uncharacterized protein n=1 Tax=Aspergillus saccharolyticus JOP 1030-1 TaxID=1450539 RepID=A0A318ZLZ7_9EURO|nr:hypothetical protein BP01DRAFT_389822 [Aspergillus saccharolyticus JOP 1030-1]PYH47937.1 hypothetical protein BP01DRAFT_389822 [Aspergillus saccharolyticus JOP 1030-1]